MKGHVGVQGATIYDSPSVSANVVQVLPGGAEVEILGRVGDFYVIEVLGRFAPGYVPFLLVDTPKDAKVPLVADVQQAGRNASRRRRGSWWPAAGGFVGALLVGGLISGLHACTENREASSKLDKLLETAGVAYQQQAERQAQIDLLYEPCSEQWVHKTTKNSVEALQSLVELRDAAAVTSEGQALLGKACADGDLDAYCKGWAQVVKKWAVGEVGSTEDIERGCRASAGLE